MHTLKIPLPKTLIDIPQVTLKNKKEEIFEAFQILAKHVEQMQKQIETLNVSLQVESKVQNTSSFTLHGFEKGHKIEVLRVLRSYFYLTLKGAVDILHNSPTIFTAEPTGEATITRMGKSMETVCANPSAETLHWLSRGLVSFVLNPQASPIENLFNFLELSGAHVTWN